MIPNILYHKALMYVGVCVCFPQGIDPISLDMLAREGIVALRRAKRRNMERWVWPTFSLTSGCGFVLFLVIFLMMYAFFFQADTGVWRHSHEFL